MISHATQSTFRIDSTWGSVIFALALTGGIILATVASVSNSPIVIGLLAGTVLGVFLLLKTEVAVWAMLVGGLLVNGAIALYFPGLVKATWLFSILGFFLFAAAFLHSMRMSRTGGKVPAFVWTAGAFVALAVVSSLINGAAPLEALAGFKRYFQTWGLLFALAIIAYKPQSVRSWLTLIFVVAMLQLPIAAIQRVVLVPLRAGLGGGVVAIDVVSGTFDANLEGGGSSSIMALLVIAALGFVIASWREGLLRAGRAAMFGIVLVAPLALGDTKVAVILLPLMLIFVLRYYLKSLGTSILLLVTGVLVATALGWIYLEYFAYSSQNLTIGAKLDRIIAYNFGAEGYYNTYGLNRTTVLSFWWAEHGLHNPLQTVFGHGLGASYSGFGSLVPGYLFAQYPYQTIGLTTASTILWDVGLTGFLAYLLLHFQAWRVAAKAAASAKDSTLRAISVTLQSAIVLFVMMIFYSNSMVLTFSIELLWCVVLGYLAWASRQGVLQPRLSSDRSIAVP